MSDFHIVDGLLGPGGTLASVLPGYESRPEQLKMARAVERCFEERGYLLAEAGTGTGKTLAYLVPAVLSGRKVVISTATKTLQEQIFFKDIPLLQDQVKLDFDAAYLKGRSNYLCLHRLETFRGSPEFRVNREAEQWPKIRDWAERTQTGDRAELDLPEDFAAWADLSTTADTCLGARCQFYEPCFVTRMRRRAEQADVLVVNHHLFFADLAIRTHRARSGEGVLPKYDAVVFDEAHAIESVATEYFGCQVSNWRLQDLSADAQRALSPTDARHSLLSAAALKLQTAAEVFLRSAIPRLGISVTEASVRLGPDSFSSLRDEVAGLVESLGALGALTQSWDEAELAALSRRSGELAEELGFICAADSPDCVYWAEQRGRGLFLRAAPIDIASELHHRLYRAVDTLVYTSATLTAQGRFDYFARRMGLIDESRADLPPLTTLAVESPFDYRKQAALYLPSHLPEPSSVAFIEAAAEEIISLAELNGARAFALFTSLRNMQAAHQLAKQKLRFPVLIQGERPKSALLEQFKREPSVLFAAHSFWEGVDVPGDALSLVIIDRLPFAAPGDPLVAARIDQ
ncbi:MAG TPA: ATP-dependent DNA helicase, partial [Myxococcaceae bacterium]|nr:ATP-dependent DNA helicase [Myxococcaceae bacterium]